MNTYKIIYKVFEKRTLTLNVFLFDGIAYIQSASNEFAEAKFVCSFDKKLSIEIIDIYKFQ
jgi:hypothetical protein